MTQLDAAESGRLRRGLRAAARAERDGWVSLTRWVLRRPRVPAGATAFGYHAPVLTVLIIFVVLSAVELVIVDIVVHALPAVRIPLLIVGVWGLLFMLGMLAGYLTRPHAVGPAGIRARRGAGIDIDLPWQVIASVAPARDVLEKAPLVREEAHGATLALRPQDETNVLIELEHPTRIRLGDDAHTITAVRLWADDLPGFLAAVRTHIP